MHNPSKKTLSRSLKTLLSAAFIVASVGTPSVSAMPLSALKAQPQLLALASEQPAGMVAVIVQKNDNTNKAESLLTRLGGRVTMPLGIINAFAAEMPLAVLRDYVRSESVRWVSLDSVMQDSSWNGDLNGGVGQSTAIASSQSMTTSTGGYQVAIGASSSDGVGSDTLTTMPLQTMPVVSTQQGGVEIPALDPKAGRMNSNGEIVPAQPLSDDATQSLPGGRRHTQWVDGGLSIDPNALRNVYHYAVRAADAWNEGYSGSGVGVAVIDSGIKSNYEDFHYDYDTEGTRVVAATGYHIDNSADMSCGAAQLGAATTLTFVNESPDSVASLYLRDSACNEHFYGLVWYGGGQYTQQAQNGQMWVLRHSHTNAVWRTHRTARAAVVRFAPPAPTDSYGHGTHVAGIIAGSGRAADGRAYAGVAPKAHLLDVRVIKDDGSSRASNVVAGMQWVLQNKVKYNIRVVNISLNAATYESYHTNPLCAAAEVLWFNGIVVVVSGGNRGAGNLLPPANDPFVITVGATDDKGTLTRTDDTLAPFSAYGIADGVAKPDLVAPGRFIKAPMPSAKLVQDGRARFVEGEYYKMSGTSMSAPIVSGAVAVLLQREPSLTPDQVKYRLKKTATPFVSSEVAGAGLLNMYGALTTWTNASANTGTPMSRLLTGGSTQTWASVSWSSVSWSSVSWSSDYVEP